MHRYPATSAASHTSPAPVDIDVLTFNDISPIWCFGSDQTPLLILWIGPAASAGIGISRLRGDYTSTAPKYKVAERINRIVPVINRIVPAATKIFIDHTPTRVNLGRKYNKGFCETDVPSRYENAYNSVSMNQHYVSEMAERQHPYIARESVSG